MTVLDHPCQPPLQPEARSRIVAAAVAVFLSDGFAGASIDAIAAAARMSKVSIYEVFPNKAALFEAAVREACDRHFIDAPGPPGVASLVDYLHQLGRAVFERFLDPVNFGLFRANIEAANQFPELAAMLHEHRRQSGQAGAQHLQRWIDDGSIAGFDAFGAATRFTATCVEGSRYFLGAPAPDSAERARIVDRVTALVLDGYRAAAPGDADDQPDPPPPPPAVVATRMEAARFEQLLAAATEEFLVHGYKGASIDRIVAVIRAGRTTVYRHFGRKEGLFRHVVGGLIDRETAKPYGLGPVRSDLQADLAALAEQALDRHCEWGNIKLHRLLIQEAGLAPDLAVRFYDGRVQGLGRALTQVLGRHGQRAPSTETKRDFYNLATSALRYLTVSTFPDRGQRHAEAGEVARIFLNGIRG